jgi:hypothetical protein
MGKQEEQAQAAKEKEAAIMHELEEEASAREVALLASQQAEALAAQHEAALVQAQTPVTVSGDVTVICLKTEAFVTMGARKYQFKKGNEIQMDAGHAAEMPEWVVIIPSSRKKAS